MAIHGMEAPIRASLGSRLVQPQEATLLADALHEVDRPMYAEKHADQARPLGNGAPGGSDEPDQDR